MKEKPQKPGKASKQDKKAAAPEPELTPKQLKEKRREEARARAAETRKIVTAGIGQWTGKLPAQLLNEHAQKMKWERVEYPVKPFGAEPNQEWTASVILARRNAKTREIERVRMDGPPDRVPRQPTQVEARNLAATYAMHRVLSHRNMKMMLPPFHRDLWVQLDEDKAQAKPHEQYKWSEDPWQAEQDRRAAKQRLDAEREEKARKREELAIAQEARAHTEAAPGAAPGAASGTARRVKFNSTLVMSRKTRAVVDDMIRSNNGFRFSPDAGLDKIRDAPKYTKICSTLQKLGFALPFAEEALEYTATLSAALTWLLVHVPEDDLPKMFTPSNIGVTARVSSSMAVENATTRLRELGYSEDVARSTATKFDGSIPQAVVKLTHSFVHEADAIGSATHNGAAGGDTAGSAEDDIWLEEIESMQAILEESMVAADGAACTLASRSAGIKISFFKSKDYPASIPGIGIEPLGSAKFAKFVLLDATRRAAAFAQAELRGDFMLMMLFDRIESTFAEVVQNPGKLAQISSAVSGVDEIDRYAQAAHERERAGKQRRQQVRRFDARAVAEQRQKRMASPEGRAMLKARSQLPAWDVRDAITNIVHSHQITLITGETGSGKSTQAVQFILDADAAAQIICTQPRRISAMGVAQRVADERIVPIGSEVGYVIRGEAKMSAQTQLRFVTSGVLLRMLQGADAADADGGLAGITHIVVDEVHERSLDGDFLLILLKRLTQKAPKLKIVLMSATVDPKQFVNYFAPMKVGYTHIAGRTFPVTQHFLGDILTATGYKPRSAKRGARGSGNGGGGGGGDYDDDDDDDDESPGPGQKGMSIGRVIGAIRANNRGVDYALVGVTVEHIHRQLTSRGDKTGSILVFMSGAGEIDQALRAISSTAVGSELWALPLHAGLPPRDQSKVFSKAPRGLRKVVASTNVAETSITIADIVAVVDTGRVKETVYDAEANVSRLVDTWTSQASATQRMGRAGRVQAGECYKLYTEDAQARMPPRPLPEILRSPLEVLYLNVKAMGISNVERFLSRALDPPKSVALETARHSLVSYGAIDAVHDTLTPLGQHMSVMPTDPRTAKLLVLGAMLGCLSRTLTVAAILSTGKLPFIQKRDDDEKRTRAALISEFGGASGDLVAGCRAFEQYLTGSYDKELVSSRVCKDIRSTRRQLVSSLAQIGFVDPDTLRNGKESLDRQYTKYDHEEAILRAVVGAALRPNVAEIVFPQQKFVSTSGGTVEKDGVDDARQIKLFTPSGERVFTHPRSLMFGVTTYVDGSKYLSYGSQIVTAKHFVSEISPLSMYSLVLFASAIDVDPLGAGIVVDGWTGLKCWPRVGVLLQFLQQLFSELMERKFKVPNTNVIDHPVTTLVHDLLESEGKAAGIGLLA